MLITSNMFLGTLQKGGRRNLGKKNGWENVYFCFLCTQKKSILVASQNWSWATDVTWTVLPMYLLRFWTWEHFSCVAVYGESIKALRLNQKHLNLCSEDERSSYGFGTTWGWVINDIISILGWTNPLIGSRKKREPNLQYLAYLNTILFLVFILIL